MKIQKEVFEDGETYGWRLSTDDGHLSVMVQSKAGASFIHKKGESIGIIFDEEIEVMATAMAFAKSASTQWNATQKINA